MKKETILLSKLNCPSCASELQKAFQKLPGIKEASVTFATGMLQLEYDEGQVKSDKVDQVVKSFGLGIASRM